MGTEVITEEQAKAEIKQFQNSLGDLVAGLYGSGFMQGHGAPASQAGTLFVNNRWYLISNWRSLLSQLYVEHGIVQTLIDQPVDDGFSQGFEIKSGELDGNDIEQILVYMRRHGVIKTITQAIKWSRLFGGGAILIVTDQDPKTPFYLDMVTPNTKLAFKAVDMWELYFDQANFEGDIDFDDRLDQAGNEFYNYYGNQVHHSRVLRISGKEAPSFIRPRLRGWGMSAMEPVVRNFNQYLKNQDVIFELLDEAKVDVFKMKGFNQALQNPQGTQQVTERIQGANMIKNYMNALTMDKEDEYEQKQMTFAGLAEVLIQIRQGIAADLKIPVTKLFGISAAGFNSGEDDIENYNAMIEGEIRSKSEFVIADVVNIIARKLFDFNPTDLQINWPSLRILKATEQEEVKDKQFNRIERAYMGGLMEGKEAKEAINKASLLPVEIDANIDAAGPLGQQNEA